MNILIESINPERVDVSTFRGAKPVYLESVLVDYSIPTNDGHLFGTIHINTPIDQVDVTTIKALIEENILAVVGCSKHS